MQNSRKNGKKNITAAPKANVMKLVEALDICTVKETRVVLTTLAGDAAAEKFMDYAINAIQMYKA